MGTNIISTYNISFRDIGNTYSQSENINIGYKKARFLSEQYDSTEIKISLFRGKSFFKTISYETTSTTGDISLVDLVNNNNIYNNSEIKPYLVLNGNIGTTITFVLKFTQGIRTANNKHGIKTGTDSDWALIINNDFAINILTEVYKTIKGGNGTDATLLTDATNGTSAIQNKIGNKLIVDTNILTGGSGGLKFDREPVPVNGTSVWATVPDPNNTTTVKTAAVSQTYPNQVAYAIRRTQGRTTSWDKPDDHKDQIDSPNNNHRWTSWGYTTIRIGSTARNHSGTVDHSPDNIQWTAALITEYKTKAEVNTWYRTGVFNIGAYLGKNYNLAAVLAEATSTNYAHAPRAAVYWSIGGKTAGVYHVRGGQVTEVRRNAGLAAAKITT